MGLICRRPQRRVYRLAVDDVRVEHRACTASTLRSASVGEVGWVWADTLWTGSVKAHRVRAERYSSRLGVHRARRRGPRLVPRRDWGSRRRLIYLMP